MRTIYRPVTAMLLSLLVTACTARHGEQALAGHDMGLSDWQAASRPAQLATAAHYIDVWRQNGLEMGDVDDEMMRACIDEHIAADSGIMATAASCAMVHFADR